MKDIMPSVGKIMMNNEKSLRAFAKLNAIANLEHGTDILKSNGANTNGRHFQTRS